MGRENGYGNMNTVIINNFTQFVWIEMRVHMERHTRLTERKVNDTRGYLDLYKAIIDQSPLPILLIDPESGGIYEANVVATQFYECKRAELLSKRVYDIHTLTRQEVELSLRNVGNQGTSSLYLQHTTASGDVKDVKIDSIHLTIHRMKIVQLTISDLSKFNIQDTFYQVLFEKSPYSIALLNTNFQIVSINSNFQQLFGFKVSEVKGVTPDQLIYPDWLNHEELQKQVNSLSRLGIVKVETIRKKKDGQLVSVELILLPSFQNGVHVATYALYVDLTEARIAESYNQLLGDVLTNHTEGVVITNEKGIIEWVNVAFTKITGYASSELIGNNPRMLQSGKYDLQFYKNMWSDIHTTGQWSGEIWNHNKKGELFPQSLRIYTIEHATSKKYVGVAKDISERKEWEEKVDNLIYTDQLTGLYNRSYITNCLEKKIQDATHKKEKLVVICFDLDNFKDINDNLGQALGDRILQTVTSKLLRVFQNTIIGRFSGDEFVIILNEANPVERAIVKIERMIDELKKSIWVENHEVFVSGSFGAAIYPKHGLDGDTILANADIAMFKAKQSVGSHYTFFTDMMKESVKREFKIRNYLHSALENHEFELWYQPIVELSTLKIVGAESLIRWKQPKLGFLPPDQFIPIAENSGHIHQLGKWVLKQACTQTKELHNRGFVDQYVAVNVSVKQLENEYFAETVCDILTETGVVGRLLTIEVTEETSISDSEKIQMNIEKLAQLGVKCSIDDFGIGYSSLAKLHELQVDQLKIDKSFIWEHQKSEKIVYAILSMAKNLQLRVVSEGIETKGQLEFLTQAGSDFGQGYYFTKPLPFEQYQTFLSEWQINKVRLN